jgi:hyperosmotically inducible protein
MIPAKKTAFLAAGFALMIAGSAHAESAGQYVDDATITGKVKAALVADKKVPATAISVDTNQGVVKLTGNVSNDDTANAAQQDARAVTGVKAVANMLKVGTSEND